MIAPRLAALPKDDADAVVLVAELMARAFFRHRPPRSDVYREGAQACLVRRATGVGIHCPYAQGSVAFDAFYAGVDEGRSIWAKHLDQVNANRAALALGLPPAPARAAGG